MEMKECTARKKRADTHRKKRGISQSQGKEVRIDQILPGKQDEG